MSTGGSLLESAEGQRFEVLKKRRIAGIDTLILRECKYGSFSISRCQNENMGRLLFDTKCATMSNVPRWSDRQRYTNVSSRSAFDMRIHLIQRRGMGNQLFQYAAGLFFAKRYGATLDIIREPDDLAVSFGHPRLFFF